MITVYYKSAIIHNRTHFQNAVRGVSSKAVATIEEATALKNQLGEAFQCAYSATGRKINL